MRRAPLTKGCTCLLHIPLHDHARTAPTLPIPRDLLQGPVLHHPSTITTVEPRDHARTPRHNIEACSPSSSPDTSFRNSDNRQSIVKLCKEAFLLSIEKPQSFLVVTQGPRMLSSYRREPMHIDVGSVFEPSGERNVRR